MGYRRLSALTVRDLYQLPRMDECIDSLGDAKCFTTLVCNIGHWQIPVHTRDREKTTFTCHSGIYRFTLMRFGLNNAPATFQRAIDIILSGVKCRSCLIYLDDVIIFSSSENEHIDHLDGVLSALSRAGVSLKAPKCHFFKQSVDYLEHVVRSVRLSLAEKNSLDLNEAKHPTTQTELRSFIELCNVCRCIIL